MSKQLKAASQSIQGTQRMVSMLAGSHGLRLVSVSGLGGDALKPWTTSAAGWRGGSDFVPKST